MRAANRALSANFCRGEPANERLAGVRLCLMCRTFRTMDLVPNAPLFSWISRRYFHTDLFSVVDALRGVRIMKKMWLVTEVFPTDHLLA